MVRIVFCLILLNYSITAIAQSRTIDSLQKALLQTKQDSNRVMLLWKLAEQYQFFKPDTTVQLAQKALLLAQRSGYIEGESRSLAVMATGQYLMGNYPAALNNYLLKLQLEEKRASSRNYASALNNIGLMYTLLNDYSHALDYLRRADSTVNATGGATKKELQNPVLINIGEAYYRMGRMDSATHYFTQSLQVAQANASEFSQGASLLGLGNIAAAANNNILALQYYRSSFGFLNDGTNSDMLCEVSLGLANVFTKTQQLDSALYYGTLTYETGANDGLPGRQLDAAIFLSSFYKNRQQFDSAFAYLERANTLQDTLKGQVRQREIMAISTAEKLRQDELAEQKRLEKADRVRQLEIRAICIFIPLFFLLTLGISRVQVHPRFIRFMGVVSLLLVFEFLTLLLHPLISDVTHHNKILELLLFVVIGAALVPLHHKMEHLLIERLFRKPGKTVSPIVSDDIEVLPVEDVAVETENELNEPKADYLQAEESSIEISKPVENELQEKSASVDEETIPTIKADIPDKKPEP